MPLRAAAAAADREATRTRLPSPSTTGSVEYRLFSLSSACADSAVTSEAFAVHRSAVMTSESGVRRSSMKATSAPATRPRSLDPVRPSSVTATAGGPPLAPLLPLRETSERHSATVAEGASVRGAGTNPANADARLTARAAATCSSSEQL